MFCLQTLLEPQITLSAENGKTGEMERMPPLPILKYPGENEKIQQK
jgi:hypothetical protein